MPFADLLLPELTQELAKLRRTLARMPVDQHDYKPHAKSMPLGKLTTHSAQMPLFIAVILTTPSLNMAVTKMPSLAFESTEQLLAAFDKSSADAHAALQATTDQAFEDTWSLSAGDHHIFTGTRYHAYRSFGMNHLIHHRAQLGTYLRQLDLPVPSIYGPSADERP